MDFPQDVLTSFANGAVLDLRLRTAIDMVRTSPALAKAAEATLDADDKLYAQKLVALALDIADALMAQGKARGWVAAMPDTADLSVPVKKHLARQANVQVESQLALSRAAGAANAGIQIPKTQLAS
jgi:hypothetical protein